jgi:hypothetical protein
MEWWEDKPPAEVTLEEMNKLSERMVELRAEKDKAEDVLSDINHKLSRLENQFLAFLKENGMKSYKNPHGHFSITKRVNVTQPVDRDAFVEYLKQKGDFDSMFSFNSQKLKSYVMAEIEEKAREGDSTWLPPGIAKPSEFETISFRKK